MIESPLRLLLNPLSYPSWSSFEDAALGNSKGKPVRKPWKQVEVEINIE